MTTIKQKFSIALTTILVACGGGGGGGTVTPPIQVNYQLKTAFVNYVTFVGSEAFTASGTYTTGNTTYSVTGNGIGTNGPLSPTTFEGVTALVKTANVTGTITMNGESAPLNTSGNSYIDSNYNFLGLSGNGYYLVVTSLGIIPTTGHLNDVGNWYTANIYSTSAKTTLLGIRTITYVIEQESDSTAFLTLITTDKNTSGTTISTVSNKYSMNALGTLIHLRDVAVGYLTSPVSTTSLTFTY